MWKKLFYNKLLFLVLYVYIKARIYDFNSVKGKEKIIHRKQAEKNFFKWKMTK